MDLSKIASRIARSHEDIGMDEWEEIRENNPKIDELLRSTGYDYPPSDDPVWDQVMKLLG